MERKNKEDWIEKQNKKIAHYVWTIFISMVTAILVTLAATGQL